MQLGQGSSALFAQSPLDADRCRAPDMPGAVRTLLYAARGAARYPHIAAYRLPDAMRTFLGCIACCSASFARCIAALLSPLYAAPLCIERCCESRTIADKLLDACQNEQNCASNPGRAPLSVPELKKISILDVNSSLFVSVF